MAMRPVPSWHIFEYFREHHLRPLFRWQVFKYFWREIWMQYLPNCNIDEYADRATGVLKLPGQ